MEDFIRNGDVESLKNAIMRGADLEARLVIESNYRPLHAAVYYDMYDIVDVLLNAGADVNARTIADQTPLNLAAACSDVKVVKRLLTAGAAVNARNHAGGYTSLHTAVCRGRADIVSALLHAGADANARSNMGSTPIHFFAAAASLGCATEVAEMLLDFGADANARTNAGEAVADIGTVVGKTIIADACARLKPGGGVR